MVATVAPLEDAAAAARMPMHASTPAVAMPAVAVAVGVDVDVDADVEPSPQVVAMRAMSWDDIDQVRELHEQWFPIRYQQSFYDGAAQGVWRETGHPLFTRLAVEVPPTAPTPRDAYAQAQYHQWGMAPSGNSSTAAYLPPPSARPNIVGAVMASTIPLSSVEDPGLIDAHDVTHTHVMYILTLGSRTSMRRRGIASALLAECIAEARRQPHCGAVYLHVKADNASALRFYEKNGFQTLRFLEDYYVIDGVRHSAYLYILHVNGAAPQAGWLELLTKPLLAFFSMASHSLKRLLDGLIEDDEAARTSNGEARRGRVSKSAPSRSSSVAISCV